LPNGKVLVTGGSLDHHQYTGMADAEVYHPVQDEWTTVNPMHDARVGHTASVLHNGNVLIAGGDLSSIYPSDISMLYNSSEHMFT